MKMMMVLMTVFLIALGSVMAEPLPGMATRASKSPVEKVREGLKNLGVFETADQDLILSDWDETKLVDVALRVDAMRLLALAARQDGLQDESVQRILEHEQAKATPSDGVWSLYLFLNRKQQAGFEPLLEVLIAQKHADQPIQAAMARKYMVGMGQPEITVKTGTADLVSMLLAPETIDLPRVKVLKRTIKDQAVRMAKRKLREEGGTFVVQEDGVNPLLAKVRPVVDALNAPMAEGLEAALRGVGADVQNQDRTDLTAKVAEWKESILMGGVPRSDDLLGRLTVGLGVDGFNAFVDEYNHGENGKDATP
jgi:hypothetical protein